MIIEVVVDRAAFWRRQKRRPAKNIFIYLLKFHSVGSSLQARNFLDCVKSRAETVSPAGAALRSDAVCHIADIAIRLGRKLTFDMNKEHFVGAPDANRRLRARPMRKPWKL